MSSYKMKSLFQEVKCLECGAITPAELFPDKCSACGGRWQEALYAVDKLPKSWPSIVAKRPTSMWRYRELLPFAPDAQIVSMGEGWTPLVAAEGLAKELGHPHIWLKDERQNPTGSFKDRQAASAISALKTTGVHEIALASAGNAAAAYAAFSMRAGIKLWVFLPSSVPDEKSRELALYGVESIKITGTYDQAKRVAANFAAHRSIYQDIGAKAIPNKESMKTIAFEIVEQLGWKAPDWYIQAVSGGLGPLGVMKGFQELYQAGIIDTMPKLGIVQSAGCAPMVNAWEQGLDEAPAVVPHSLITVLSTGEPGLAYQHLKGFIDDHGGAMVSITDGEAFLAMRQVARVEGFSVEPATSVAFAGLRKMIDQGRIGPDEHVVVNCSGHTFSAEKHVLESRYLSDLEVIVPGLESEAPEKVSEVLKQLDERSASILVVDDNHQDRRLVRRLIQRYKEYRIVEAASAREGLDLAQQRKPDLIILDLTMPEMDGFAFIEALKTHPDTKDIPALIVSGKELSMDQKEFLSDKADLVFQKGGFDTDQLVKTIIDMISPENLEPEYHNANNGHSELNGFMADVNQLETPEAADEQAIAVSEPVEHPEPEDQGETKELAMVMAQVENLAAAADNPAPVASIGAQPTTGAMGAGAKPLPAPELAEDQDVSNRTILYIEDNPHNRRIVRKILEMQGYLVNEAEDGLSGWDQIQVQRPPLVLLDISLPGIDGLEVVGRVKGREDLRNIPVVALTASAMRGDRERFLEAGCDDYLSKPVRADELIQMVANYVPIPTPKK